MPRRSRLALGVLLVLITGFQGSAEPRPPEGFVGKYIWRGMGDGFGGFSAIEVLDGGQRFVALGDKAVLVSGRFDRDPTGRITAIDAGPLRPLIARKSGAPLTGRRADSEGLAIDPDGGAYVSFENRPRVARLNLQSGAVADMKAHPRFAKLPRNGALEALAAGEGPVLYAIPEESPGKRIPVFRWQDGTWDSALSLPRRGSFLPVAADVLDDRLYVLEREFRGIGGFASRLRRFDIADDGLTGEVTLLTTPLAMFDNLEGVSVWRDAQGGLRATMISDDNFFWLQQTQIVEFRLPD